MDRNRLRIGIITLGSVFLMALAPNAALAEESPAQEAGIGTAAAIGSLLYAPVKIAYALGGTVVGGLAWCFSAGDKEVAVPIFNRAVRGDYVLTPDHVRGERKIEFIGRDPEPAVATGPPAPAYPPPASDPAW